MEKPLITVPDDLATVKWETVRETLEQLTKLCESDEGRNNLNVENYRNLAFLLEFLANSENTTEHTRNKVFTEAFRFLRNSVAGSKLNQDAVTDGSKILTVTVIFFQRQVEDRNENDIRADVEKDNLHIRCALQFLANCMAGNPRNSTVISEQFSELLTHLIDEFDDDEKIIQCVAMMIHHGLKQSPCPREFPISEKLILCFLNNLHLEFVIYVVESMIQLQKFLTLYEDLKSEYRIKLITYLTSRSDILEELQEDVVFMLKVSFIERSDSILKSKLGDRDDTFCWEIASLLELLCAISLISKHVKSDTALLTTVLYLLRQIYEAGKLSGDDNVFSPLEDVGKLTSQSTTQNDVDDIRAHPTFMFKAHLIRLIGNLVHRNQINQDMVRELECIPIILDSCKIDARNPFITQWSILAIRNLCEGNEANQAYIREVQRVDTENLLPKLHLVGLN